MNFTYMIDKSSLLISRQEFQHRQERLQENLRIPVLQIGALQ